MTQAAYDMRETTKTHYRAPRVKVVQGGRSRAGRLDKLRRAAYTMRTALATILLLGLVVGLIYSQAVITELSRDIETTRQELTREQSTYDYLTGEMDDITSSTNIAAVAEGELGLVKADASQITYMDLEDEGLIVRSETGWARLLSTFQTAALSLLDGLEP